MEKETVNTKTKKKEVGPLQTVFLFQSSVTQFSLVCRHFTQSQ